MLDVIGSLCQKLHIPLQGILANQNTFYKSYDTNHTPWDVQINWSEPPISCYSHVYYPTSFLFVFALNSYLSFKHITNFLLMLL